MSDQAPKRVAAVITEWRKLSHADVLLSRILEPERWGHEHPFQLKLAAIYADQFPDKIDLCRDYCRRHQVPIYPTIKGAIGLGGSRVAVDGVLLIGEHGQYPLNGRNQQLYPRRRLFEGIVDAFRLLKGRVPVFNDKHLSYDWLMARWMYDVARHEGIPLMAGSSLPVAWRHPQFEYPIGTELTRAVGAGYGGLDAYGFHAIETLQCMVERRKGGETGVAAVQSLSGPLLDQALKEDVETRDLLNSLYRNRHGAQFQIESSATANRGTLWKIRYEDGLDAAVGMFEGLGPIFGFAGRRRDKSEADATIFELEEGRYYGHFGYLLRAVERMMLTGVPSYPVERTLLTTGLLASLLQSHSEGGTHVATPHLAEIRYQPRLWPIAPDPVGTPA
ncbi:MAG: hypothetical protein ABS79_04925 [Planctomycetes bacterium SCN 63-9]|nr:MAG: hypothetical protein ABS79_04925 [Planctomycetes bacterium SCN 63-9]